MDGRENGDTNEINALKGKMGLQRRMKPVSVEKKVQFFCLVWWVWGKVVVELS